MRKKYIFFSGLSLTILVLICVGVSYSLWNISNTQDKINTVMTSCFDITYSSDSNNINLSNTYPIADEKGLSLTPYTFTITNNCDINAYYKINLETLNSSNIDNKFIKVSLNESSPKKASMYESTDKILNNSKISNNLLTGYLPVGGTEEFNLRVWMDYDTTIDDIKNDGTDKWVGKIVVVENPVSEDEINKVCQDKGGDFIDSGECRKYYVKLNQQFNVNEVMSSYNYNIINNQKNSFSLKMPCSKDWCRFFIMNNYNINHLYYYSFNSDIKSHFTSFLAYPKENYPAVASKYERVNDEYYYYYNINNKYNSYFLVPNRSERSMWYYEEKANIIFSNFIVTDLTLMFGEGNEPSQDWCDKYLNDYYEYNSEGTLTPIKELGDAVKTSYYDKIDMFD